MSASKGNIVGTVILLVAVLAALVFFSINIGRNIGMNEKPLTISNEAKYTLVPYTGTGSGVYKHGTIVKVDASGNPTVVGHFDDDSGKEFPGTMQISEIK